MSSKLQKSQLRVVSAADSHADARYRLVFDHVSDAIFGIDSNHKIELMNLAAQELTGHLIDQLKGHSIDRIVPKPKVHSMPARSRVLGEAIFESPGTYEDVAILRSDGYVRLVEVGVRKSPDADMTILLLKDVTDKKQLERENLTKHAELQKAFFQLERQTAELKTMQETLVQAGKMAALGELALGIAHELNQPLQGIRGYTQELEHLLKDHPHDEVKTFLSEVIHNVDKMKKIIEYLRAFQRKSTEGFETCKVENVLDEAFKMLGTQLQKRGIQVERKVSGKIPDVYVNPMQLEQVFINLATNARDAIEETRRGSGTIKIETRFNAPFVEVIFQDDGCGMTEKTKSKAMNPFFTTKEIGQGMGLGLSLSYGMLTKIHGSMVLQSEWGKGTTFTIRVPQDFRELG